MPPRIRMACLTATPTLAWRLNITQSFRMVQRHLVVFQCPFSHVANSCWLDTVQNELRVIDTAEILTEQWIRVPNLLEQGSLSDHLRHAGDPNLVVLVVQVAQ